MGKVQYYRIVVDCWRMFVNTCPRQCRARQTGKSWNGQASKGLKLSTGSTTKFVKALILSAFLDEIERVQEKGRDKRMNKKMFAVHARHKVNRQ